MPHAESSMFLIGNMRTSGLVDNGQAYTGTYAAAFEDERIVGVVAHYWNQNLILQAPVHLDSLWRAAVEASQRQIAGLIGPNDQVSAVKEVLQIDESKIQFDELENLYSLRLKDLHVPAELSSGRLRGRRIAPHDLELLTQWRVAYSIEALGDKDTPHLWKRCRLSAERSLNERRTWILEDSGKPVACSSFNTAIKEAVQVGGVWTPPELRKRGYGRSVVAASLLDARCEGVEKSILFTGKSNLAAQKAYTALGFEKIGHYRLMRLRLPVDII
ncbi:GNAT family N-acetyltransferase [Oculatella sp. LEGE 06141]|uniref:GNAT family N-acetyltransferase n=1 Tax=Oculatella sp. LEGE 06141 TaxID=1828648 RepID=UPI001D14B749|nr:GNAT family N-acetyltransferase [Oculatella sp. LEGE 06141]